MVEERRAHERINELTSKLVKYQEDHAEQHRLLERLIEVNSESMNKIDQNTSELVNLFKGAKAMSSFFLWSSRVLAVLLTIWAFFSFVIQGQWWHK